MELRSRKTNRWIKQNRVQKQTHIFIKKQFWQRCKDKSVKKLYTFEQFWESWTFICKKNLSSIYHTIQKLNHNGSKILKYKTSGKQNKTYWTTFVTWNRQGFLT